MDFYLQRIPDGKGGLEWKISNATVRRIPEFWEEFGHSEFAGRLAELLPQVDWLGIDNWQWVYMLVFIGALVLLVYDRFRPIRAHRCRQVSRMPVRRF